MADLHSAKASVFRRSRLAMFLTYILLLCSFPVLGQLLLSWPVGRSISLLVNQCLLIGSFIFFVACSASFAGSLFALVFPKTRSIAFRVLVVSSLTLVLFICCMGARSAIRTKQFEDLAGRSLPLIVAIKQFEKEKSKPPSNLDELVPLYLNEVPNTGMGAYPKFSYQLRTEENHLAAPWELSVDCPLGMLNRDVFYYLPTEKYPQHDYGGYIERIKNWAYVHE